MTVRILTFTSLFPNPVMPTHGIFVLQRLQQLQGSGRVEANVVVPVPWFPSRSRGFGSYADFAAVPASAEIGNVTATYSRYPVIPKIGMSIAPLLMAVACYRRLRRLCRGPSAPQLIDAHYFYPDGIAAVLLGRWLNLPVVVTARGSDINLISRFRLPRRWIRWAASRATHIVTVSNALRDRLLQLEVEPGKVTTLRNGVDLDRFRPLENREEIRKRLKLKNKTILSVGNLLELKGHHLALEALQRLPGVDLVIAGEGPERGRLEALIDELELGDRARLIGTTAQDELVDYYNAADVLVLASSREGMANVLLESLACGTPVVATPVGGNPEVVSAPAAGTLMSGRSADDIVAAVDALFAAPPDRRQVREYAMRFNWDDTTSGLADLFAAIAEGGGPALAEQGVAES